MQLYLLLVLRGGFDLCDLGSVSLQEFFDSCTQQPHPPATTAGTVRYFHEGRGKTEGYSMHRVFKHTRQMSFGKANSVLSCTRPNH